VLDGGAGLGEEKISHRQNGGRFVEFRAQANNERERRPIKGKGKKAALGPDHLLLPVLPSPHQPASLSLAQPTLTLRPTQDSSLDTFRLEYLLPPVILISLIFNYGYNFRELTWAFSIWLESVAILPQLFMLQRTGEAETITTHYLAALGLYRGLYIPNWMYRWVLLSSFLGLSANLGGREGGRGMDIRFILRWIWPDEGDKGSIRTGYLGQTYLCSTKTDN
jgi:hypothetical protein